MCSRETRVALPFLDGRAFNISVSLDVLNRVHRSINSIVCSDLVILSLEPLREKRGSVCVCVCVGERESSEERK